MGAKPSLGLGAVRAAPDGIMSFGLVANMA
jgi:hypothetical protein